MKMFFEIFLLIIIIVFLVCSVVYFIRPLLSPASQQNPQNQVCFGSHCFLIELAKTAAEQERGLMYRTELDKNKGMLFIFDKEGIYPFWMKNTLIPLDMVWIKQGLSADAGQVVFIGQNVQPCKSLICQTVLPNVKAKYVLEINAGVCQEIGLKVGDELKISVK
jgi:uncharacterized protein